MFASVLKSGKTLPALGLFLAALCSCFFAENIFAQQVAFDKAALMGHIERIVREDKLNAEQARAIRQAAERHHREVMSAQNEAQRIQSLNRLNSFIDAVKAWPNGKDPDAKPEPPTQPTTPRRSEPSRQPASRPPGTYDPEVAALLGANAQSTPAAPKSPGQYDPEIANLISAANAPNPQTQPRTPMPSSQPSDLQRRVDEMKNELDDFKRSFATMSPEERTRRLQELNQKQKQLNADVNTNDIRRQAEREQGTGPSTAGTNTAARPTSATTPTTPSANAPIAPDNTTRAVPASKASLYAEMEAARVEYMQAETIYVLGYDEDGSHHKAWEEAKQRYKDASERYASFREEGGSNNVPAAPIGRTSPAPVASVPRSQPRPSTTPTRTLTTTPTPLPPDSGPPPVVQQPPRVEPEVDVVQPRKPFSQQSLKELLDIDPKNLAPWEQELHKRELDKRLNEDTKADELNRELKQKLDSSPIDHQGPMNPHWEGQQDHNTRWERALESVKRDWENLTVGYDLAQLTFGTIGGAVFRGGKAFAAEGSRERLGDVATLVKDSVVNFFSKDKTVNDAFNNYNTKLNERIERNVQENSPEAKRNRELFGN